MVGLQLLNWLINWIPGKDHRLYCLGMFMVFCCYILIQTTHMCIVHAIRFVLAEPALCLRMQILFVSVCRSNSLTDSKYHDYSTVQLCMSLCVKPKISICLSRFRIDWTCNLTVYFSSLLFSPHFVCVYFGWLNGICIILEMFHALFVLWADYIRCSFNWIIV